MTGSRVVGKPVGYFFIRTTFAYSAMGGVTMLLAAGALWAAYRATRGARGPG
jgi:hypothetical protein